MTTDAERRDIARRLAGKPYGLTKGERRFGIAAGIAMFVLAILAAAL